MDTVESVMTNDPICLDATTTLADAAKAMDEHDIGDVLVMQGDSLCGIVTDRDIVIRGIAHEMDPRSTALGEICSRELITLGPDDAIDDAIAHMREHAVRREPILEGDRPVGIVSLGDLARARDQGSVLGAISTAPANH